MPTKRPRIVVTLRPSTASMIKRMSQLTGNSQSSIIGNLLEESEPIFNRMCQVLAAAKEASEGVKLRVRESLEDAENVLERQLGLILDTAESSTRDLVPQMEQMQRRRVPVAGRSPSAPRVGGAPGGLRPSLRRPPPLTGGSHMAKGSGRGLRKRGRKGGG